jgi:hypothetical protein
MLFRVVQSELSDEEAANRLREVVASDPMGAKTTLRLVERMCTSSVPNYETDRAHRILVAAIQGTKPEPVRPEHAELFERERELGWMSLEQAFERLNAAVPELDAVRSRAEELAAAPELFGITEEADGLEVPSRLLPDAEGLVGPSSPHPDPLIRSRLARSVVANYVIAVLTDTTDRALWDRSRPGRRASLTGSFIPGT